MGAYLVTLDRWGEPIDAAPTDKRPGLRDRHGRRPWIVVAAPDPDAACRLARGLVASEHRARAAGGGPLEAGRGTGREGE